MTTSNDPHDPHLFPHEKLRVWQDAKELASGIYAQTRLFPRSEIHGLTSQLNRAALSVACNLAEGAARTSSKDQAHFSQLAYSSLMEIACLLDLAVDVSLMDSSSRLDLRGRILVLSNGINNLRKWQKSQIAI